MWTSNGRLEDLLDFELSHRFVHRADMAQQSRMKQLGEVLGIYLTNADEEWAAAVAAFVAQSALHGYKAAASIFGWTAPAPEEADTLLEELAALASAE